MIKGRNERAGVAVFLTVGLLVCGAPTVADPLEFQQVDFNLDGTLTMDSDWGVVDVTFVGSRNILYLNLTVDGSWEIQNVPVLSVKGDGITQTQRFWFDLGNEVGDDVASVSYGYQLTSDWLDSAPKPESFAAVGDAEITIYNAGNADGFKDIPVPARRLVGGVFPGRADDQHRNSGFPNQDCGDYECAPAAVSNSLQFLNARHNLGLDPNEITIAKMKPACGFVPGWGCPRDTWWMLKKQYMEANGFPITTRKFTASMIADIIRELDDGQDVEMEIFGHTVAVVGIVDLGGSRYQITIAHDTLQGVPGGTVEETVVWNSNTGQWEGGALPYSIGINYFVVECPERSVPAISEWGAVVTVGLLLIGITIKFGRRRNRKAA